MYNPLSGYGFITAQDDSTVFFHRSDILGKPPRVGDAVSYQEEESSLKPGKMQARNVTGGTLGGDLEGICNCYDKIKGVGFIDYQGKSYLMHRDDITGGIPHTGDTMHFNLAPSPTDPTKQECREVFGGSGQAIEPRKKKQQSKSSNPSGNREEWDAGGEWGADEEWSAGGKGKAMKGMMMSMMSMMSTVMGPYSKGKGKGKSKDKGKGKW